jgi:hypothetical protein
LQSEIFADFHAFSFTFESVVVASATAIIERTAFSKERVVSPTRFFSFAGSWESLHAANCRIERKKIV